MLPNTRGPNAFKLKAHSWGFCKFLPTVECIETSNLSNTVLFYGKWSDKGCRYVLNMYVNQHKEMFRVQEWRNDHWKLSQHRWKYRHSKQRGIRTKNDIPLRQGCPKWSTSPVQKQNQKTTTDCDTNNIYFSKKYPPLGRRVSGLLNVTKRVNATATKTCRVSVLLVPNLENAKQQDVQLADQLSHHNDKVNWRMEKHQRAYDGIWHYWYSILLTWWFSTFLTPNELGTLMCLQRLSYDCYTF